MHIAQKGMYCIWKAALKQQETARCKSVLWAFGQLIKQCQGYIKRKSQY